MDNKFTDLNGIKNTSDAVHIDLNNNSNRLSSFLNHNQAYEADAVESGIDADNTSQKTKTVRLIYCGDGVVEECEEDEKEKEKIEREEKERILEQRRKLDIEAVYIFIHHFIF